MNVCESECPTLWGKLIPCLPNLAQIELYHSKTTFGNSPQCDVIIQNMSNACPVQFVLFKPACLEYVIFISDCSSTSGTFVNGRMLVGQEMRILNGDVIGVSRDFPRVYILKLQIVPFSPNKSVLPNKLSQHYVIKDLLHLGDYKQTNIAIYQKTQKPRVLTRFVKTHKWQNDYGFAMYLQTKDELNPFVMRVVDMFHSQDEIFLLSMFIESGNLSTRVKSGLSIPQTKFLFYQILLGVDHLHNHLNVVHGRLKPENVLLVNADDPFEMVKITDYGLSHVVYGSDPRLTFSEDDFFVAPELVDGSSGYTKMADMWSLGELLHYMHTGDFCFKGNEGRLLQIVGLNVIRYIQLCGNRALRDLLPDTFPTVSNDQEWNLQNVVDTMLNVNLDLRPTVKCLCKHSWFQMDSNLMRKLQQVLQVSFKIRHNVSTLV